MIEPISITVLGIPKGQPRPRACIRGKHAGMYDSGIANEWKAAIRAAWKSVDLPLHNIPLKMSVTARFPRPKSHFFPKGGLRPNAPYWHISKPDGSNVLKLIEDTLTGLAYSDDRIIAECAIIKVYSDMPGVVITISELEAPE